MIVRLKHVTKKIVRIKDLGKVIPKLNKMAESGK
jgi:hypothetical protein